MQTNKAETLRAQKNVLNCCANCNKQLPRCYVCQLYMVIQYFDVVTLIICCNNFIIITIINYENYDNSIIHSYIPYI